MKMEIGANNVYWNWNYSDRVIEQLKPESTKRLIAME